MPSQQKSALNVVMGAMTFGEEGKEGARVHDLKDVEAILDEFLSHGFTEVDTARVYASGTSEEYLGKVDWRGKGLVLETKLFPRDSPTDPIDHSPESLRKHLLRSLKAPMRSMSIDMWYLHAPDRSVPYEITMKAVNDLYKDGYFRRFGISNYPAWEVAEIVGICRTNGWIQPTAYQGIYNAIHRSVEPELFPCLRKFGISFYEFNPLAGGFFTGRYTSLEDKPEAGSRFDPNRGQGQVYFGALVSIRAVAEEHNLTLPEIALRWISHHSLMKREAGDAVLIGASNLEHIKQNLIDLEKGPLPDKVLKALDEAWSKVHSQASQYFR
ncbi:Aldo/keto reductase [Pluteus cervinus]|uniref:Aldo/keto reductase n=1 Tax=Pluteus cervinus TaxID=181527 RepID=A0ACD3B4E9_9AGAR|nr:Aldo/keto reductase [Pluteus cervinus]